MTRQTPSWSKMSAMETTAIQEFQTHGQDIPWLLEHWADRKPDHPALVWSPREGDGRRWTYAELLVDVRRVAAGLDARGITKGDKVLIHAENCPEMVLSWLACAALGAVAVTTNTKSVGAEITYFAEHTGAVAAITQPQYAATVSAAAPGVEVDRRHRRQQWRAGRSRRVRARLRRVRHARRRRRRRRLDARPPEPMLPFGIMFTSGTTSRPKAVVHTHANAIWASRTGPRNIDLTTDDTYLIYLPFFHVNAQSWSLFSVLGIGATAVLMPKWSQSRFWPTVVDHGVTHISVMPFVMGALGGPDKPAEPHAAGGGLRADHARPRQAVRDRRVRRVRHDRDGHPLHHRQAAGAAADPVDGSRHAGLRDRGRRQGDRRALCAEGETGELWMRGTRGIQLFLEYYDNDEANAKAFEDGWFKTGDMVKIGAGGNVFYQERDKDLLKVGGENVSAKEVEDLIVAASRGAGQVAVVGKNHEFLERGRGGVRDQGPGRSRRRQPSSAEIIESCRQNLAGFKVPRAVYFVDEFPTGTLDKILKNKLREMADERPPVE